MFKFRRLIKIIFLAKKLYMWVEKLPYSGAFFNNYFFYEGKLKIITCFGCPLMILTQNFYLNDIKNNKDGSEF